MFPLDRHDDVSYYYATKQLQVLKTSKSEKPEVNVRVCHTPAKSNPLGDLDMKRYIVIER